MNKEKEITTIQDKKITSNDEKLISDDKEIIEFNKVFRKQQYTQLKWNDEEKALKYFRKNMEESFFKYSLPFSVALIFILKKSIFGTFLDVLNPNQDDALNENKFSIIDYELRHLNEVRWNRWKCKNQIFENMYGCLKYMVKKGMDISLKNVTKMVKVLRMCDYYTNSIDTKLKDFKNLQILDLTGNNLRDIDGSYLPRHLKLLELNNNFLTNLVNLTKNAPKHLIHLGLGRNCLNNDSSLHLLTETENFLELCSLDLAHNDIYDLNCTLDTLSSLPLLRSLLLEGNPCYLGPFYVKQVVTILKDLAYLDNTEILREDRMKKSVLDMLTKPKLIFQCYRLIGLPKPPPIKIGNIEQTFHIEISLPLLESVRLPPETKPLKEMSIQVGSSQINPANKSSLKKTKETVTSGNFARKISRKTIVSGKFERISSIYDKPNEYDEQKEANNFSFRSIRKPWSLIIEYPPMVIEVPNDDLLLLRDTLRSKVKVDIVYLLVAPPGNKRKSKSKVAPTEQEEPESETVFSRYTVNSFYCNLEPWNWSDESLDFYWINDPTIGCVKVTGSLKDLNYSGKKSEDPDYQPQQIPKVLSCHVGFEITRNLFYSPTEVATVYSSTFKTPRQPQLTQFTNTDENIDSLTSRKVSRT